MDRVVTYNLEDDFLRRLADYISADFLSKGADLTRIAFVFEGKRPALFLKKEFSKRIGRSFFPPRFFSIDEFINWTLSKKTLFTKMPDMESCYLIYKIAREITPEILKGREKFSQFLPWAREIAKFIDSLDIEDIPLDALKNVQASAQIGYEIPDNINAMLKNIISIRDAYHRYLEKKNRYSRGYIYLAAARAVKEADFSEFDKIFFCGFFYMQKTERQMAKYLYDIGRADFLFQGDEDEWPVLKNIAHSFSFRIKGGDKKYSTAENGRGKRAHAKKPYSLSLYSAFDRHSQVCTVREILKKIKNLDSTVIVLPDSNSMIPLVSEIASLFGGFNVSLGYPLRRSSLYSLLEFIIQAQKTRKDKEYYAKDYIACLSQPLVKNLRILSDYGATRVLVHKIEEAILGIEDTPISGRMFVKLKDVESEPMLFELAAGALRQMDAEARPADLGRILAELHSILFAQWEAIGNFREFAASLGRLLDVLVRKSLMKEYGLNLKIAEKMFSIMDELQNAPFSGEEFSKEEIFKIFQDMLEHEAASFSGSPLKGLQILGPFETRSLSFENVIVMDVNESVLPKLSINEPLIPYDVSLNLGLKIIENEEEIQRYQFKRLISAAKNVFLVYEENPEKERSRFAEELIWDMQKEKNVLDALPIPQVNFSLNVLPSKTEIKKTKDMTDFFKNLTYSASSIDTYVRCPLQFYFKYCLGLEEKKEFPKDPEGREIGTFIHELLRDVFSRFVGKRPEIDTEFRGDFFDKFDKKFKDTFGKRMRSDSFLLEDVMRYRLERFLDYEEAGEGRNVEEILYLEKEFKKNELILPGGKFNFTYIVDRVDRLEGGSILILDYKTGMDILKPQKADILERMELNRESIKDRIKSFQLPLYYYFERKKYEKAPLNAAIYSLRNLKLTYLDDGKSDINKVIEICMKGLDFVLHEILDGDKPFLPDKGEEKNCRLCPFFYMCR